MYYFFSLGWTVERKQLKGYKCSQGLSTMSKSRTLVILYTFFTISKSHLKTHPKNDYECKYVCIQSLMYIMPLKTYQ